MPIPSSDLCVGDEEQRSEDSDNNTAAVLGEDAAELERFHILHRRALRQEKAAGLRFARDLRRRFGRPDRLAELIEAAHLYEGADWLWALGDLWQGLEGIGMYQYEILEQLFYRLDNIDTVIPELMDKEERTAFESLPDEFVIYRGCRPLNVRGFSWSLNREVALKFAYRFETEVPMLLTARIPKTRAAALKLGREEQEIIVFDYTDEPSLRWTGESLPVPRQERNRPRWC